MNYLEQLFSFKDKYVVITGGAGVIAQSLALAFLQAEATVSLWGRNEKTLVDATSSLLEQSRVAADKIDHEVVDCCKKNALKKAFENCVNKQGVPHVLINCVGGNDRKVSFLEQDDEHFKKIIDLNLLAGLLLPSQICIKAWIEEKIKGTIINFTSMAAYSCFSSVWAYDAAKAGVLNLTRGMAKEFAANGIRVNSIAPGFFLGKQNKTLLIQKDKPYTLTERGEQVIERTAMKRFGNKDDLQAAVLFLASNRASAFITGIDLPVDGGFLADSI